MDAPAAALSWIDWTAVILYLVLVAVIGAWCAGRQSSTEEYFVGGRTIPGWAAGLSLFASAISTATFLAYPGHGYAGDWTRLLPGLMLPVVALFIAAIVVPFYRRVVRMSAYEFLEQRFGYPARAYAALLFILFNVFRTGFILFLTSAAIHTLTGWNIVTVMLISGLATIAYTVVGGIDAVIWTDVMQAVVLLAGGLVCVGVLLFSVDGGPMHAIAIASAADKFKLADWSLDLTRPSMLVLLSFGLFYYAGSYTTGQDSVQRYLAVPTTRGATRGVWLGAWGCVLTWTLFMFIGTLLYSYYAIHPDQLPAAVAAKQTQVFPYFILTRLPAGLVGVIIAAMLAAAMSSLDTSINSMAMVSVEDFYRRLRPGATDQRRLTLAKWATLVWGLLGTAAGLSMLRVERALDFSYQAASILAGGLFGLFLLAFFDRKAHARGLYAGMFVGVAVTAWGSFDKLVEVAGGASSGPRTSVFPFDTMFVVTLANLASLAVGFLASRVLPARRRPAAVDATA